MRQFYILTRLVIFLCCSLLWILPTKGQETVETEDCTKCTFRINRVDLNRENKSLEIFLNAKDENGVPLDPNKTKIEIFEKKSNEEDENYLSSRIDQVLDYSKSDSLGRRNRVPPTVLFLLDISGSMCGRKIRKAKDAILTTLNENNLPANSTYFATFHDYVSASQLLSIDNYDEVMQNVNACGDFDTDLFYAIDSKVKEFKEKTGRRYIILLTDGRNDILRNSRYKSERKGGEGITPLSDTDVYTTVENLDNDFFIHAVGLGDPSVDNDRGLDESFLETLVAKTPNKKDGYKPAASPDKIEGAFSEIAESIEENLMVEVYPQDCVYKGRLRDLKVTFNYNEGQTVGESVLPYSYGASAAQEAICRESNATAANNPFVFLIGLLFIGLTLGILIYMVPIIGFSNFKNKYVMKYGKYLSEFNKSADVRRKDAYTQELLEINDEIVVKCSHLMKLGSWQANSDQCIYYPDRCKEGFSSYKKGGNFFRQQGLNRKLNWLWFGGVGGLLAWGLFTLLTTFNVSLGESLWGKYFENAISLNRQMLSGISLGAMITLMLAIVEERGQARKFNIGRVLLRTLIGALLAIPVFLLGELFYSYVLPHNYFGRLFSWVLFGTALGFVMSINSSIKPLDGVKGGLIASLIAFHAFLLLPLIVGNYEYGNLFGYILYGAFLGLLIVYVVSTLEDFELEYLTPDHFSGVKVSISKWLKSGAVPQIYIGTDHSCHVFIKWNDKQVLSKHASLTYDGDVYIEPIGETLINGRIIKGQTVLKHGDIIKLGSESNSKMQFLSKETNSPNSPQPKVVVDQKAKRGEQIAKSKIKISKRS